MSSPERRIRIVIDSRDASAGAARVNTALASIGKTAGTTGKSLKSANDNVVDFGKGADRVANQMRNANGQFVTANGSILKMAKSLGIAAVATAGLTALTAGLALLTAGFSGAADKATLMEAKLRIATNSAWEYAAATKEVNNIANRTRSDVSATADLYTKMAQTTKNAGAATQSFAMLLKVGGAETNQATAAILQLGQALGSGKLSGDEFVSLNENAGEFMKTLAASLGVARGDLKKLASEGKITSDVIVKALTDPAMVARIEAQFGQIAVTFGDVKTALGNMFQNAAGALKDGLGIDDSLAVIVAKINTFATNALPFFTQLGAQIRGVFNAIAPAAQAAFAVIGPIVGLIAQNMESVVRIAMAVGGAFIAMKASMGLAGVIKQVVGLGASMGATGGFASFFSGAMTMASGAVKGFTTALLLNPFTAIITGLTLAVGLLVQFSDKIRLPGQEFGRLNDIVRVLFGDFVRHVSNTFNGIMKFGNAVKSVFQAFGTLGRAAFGIVGNIASNLFNSLDRMTGGWLSKTFGSLESIKNGFSAAFGAISAVWSNLPAIIGGFVVSTVNNVITSIESMVNRAIGGLNQLINMAKKVPGAANISNIGEVKFGRVDPVAYTASVFNRAETGGAARAARNARDAAGGGNNSNSTNTPSAAATGGGAGGATDSAANKAAEMAKSIREFWTGLEASRDAAGLLGIELERHNAMLELRKTLGDGDASKARELTELEKTKINTLLQETATRKAISDLQQSAQDRTREGVMLAQRAGLIASMTADQLDDEMAVRERMADLAAQYGRDGADMNSQAIKDALALEESLMRQNQARAEANKLLSEQVSRGRELITRYGREADPRAEALRLRTQRDADISKVGRGKGETEAEWRRNVQTALAGSAREYNEALTEIAQKWRNEMLDGIDQIADAFGGELGDIISKMGRLWDSMARAQSGDYSQSGVLGGIAKLFSGDSKDPTKFGKGVAEGTSRVTLKALTTGLKNPIASMGDGFKSFTSAFSSANGGFVKGLGNAIGGAMQGGAIGSAIGGIGKALFKDAFSETGSQIGGMVGSIFGPIGSVLGSIGGGFLGGLFKKKPSASSNITLGPDGTLTVGTSGNKAAQREAADAAGNKVVDGITAIAQRLGADLGGNPNVSIGKYKDEWKVSTSGQTVGKKVGQSFGSDVDAAIMFAIQDLIRDGILTGLSSFSDRLLRNTKNLDSALSLAESYEKLLKELGALKDPLGASITGVTDSLDKMVKMMRDAGATSAEMAKVEEYRKLKLDEILKSQLSGLNDFRKSLSGEGSGVSAMNRLTAAQGEFARMQAQIAGGGAIDQDAFTKAGQDIFALAREIFGSSSSQFQNIRAMLMDATDGAIANVTDRFNDASVVAINQQTEAVTGRLDLQTDVLQQINEQLARMGGSAFSVGGASAINGIVRSQAV